MGKAMTGFTTWCDLFENDGAMKSGNSTPDPYFLKP